MASCEWNDVPGNHFAKPYIIATHSSHLSTSLPGWSLPKYPDRNVVSVCSNTGVSCCRVCSEWHMKPYLLPPYRQQIYTYRHIYKSTIQHYTSSKTNRGTSDRITYSSAMKKVYKVVHKIQIRSATHTSLVEMYNVHCVGLDPFACKLHHTMFCVVCRLLAACIASSQLLCVSCLIQL